jgi:prepilin-type N-terminal cleavage/methylation domain-containing protein
MKVSRKPSTRQAKGQRAIAEGFSLVELLVAMAVLLIVLGTTVEYIAVAIQRSKAEQTKVDLTQDGRSFVDEFERDLHQAGYPSCRMFNTSSNCSLHFVDRTMAVGLVYVSNRSIVFEGDVDGDGNVDSVRYRLVDSSGNFPPIGTCPCTLQRSQVQKADGVAPLSQAAVWGQELENVVNSGVPATGLAYGGGLAISGNVAFSGGSLTNDAYYAAVTTVKDYPVFSAYDQDGILTTLPVDISTPTALANIKSVRLTINLLGSGITGNDLKTGVRPLVTMVGDSRINN